jgi:RNA polymerase sigma factor for flagellar operon FliA
MRERLGWESKGEVFGDPSATEDALRLPTALSEGLMSERRDRALAEPVSTSTQDGILPPPAVKALPIAGRADGYPPVSALPLQLSPEQEQVLLEHLPIVRFLARRIHERLPQHVEIDDLFSAGIVGLMDAFAKFDPEKKVQFRSYAQFRIRGAILDSLRTLDWSPRELRRKGRAVEEAIRLLSSRLGRAPGEMEIAAELGIGLETYQQLLGELKGLEIGTLHMERNEDSGEEELAYVPGSPEEDPLYLCLRGEMEERLTIAIQELPERERLVMTLYYYEEMTMREIGMALGVVESRISQIHASAVLHLRSALADLSTSEKLKRRSKPGRPGKEDKTGTSGLLGKPPRLSRTADADKLPRPEFSRPKTITTRPPAP